MFQGTTAYPLEKYSVFASSDMEEVIDSVTQSYCAHDLVLRDHQGHINARYHRLPLNDISLNYLQYGAVVDIDIGPFEEFYMLEFPLSGQVSLEYGEDRIVNRTGTAALISPIKPLKSQWSSECAEVMIKINRRKLEVCLSEIIGSVLPRPLEFSPLIDLTSPSGRTITEYVRYLVSQAEKDSPVLGFGNSVGALEQALFNLLLTCQPHNYSDAIAARRSPAVPHYVAKARKYIHENLKNDIRLKNVAAASGVTERTLFDGFKRFMGITPFGYIRNRRLECVRHDLTATRPSVTVTDIALKWGFTHLGRFSRDYFLRFGEKPSRTVRAC